MERYRYLYGPVPSRRLGRSLGLDLVPYKTCSYDCVYCHLGRTTDKTIERREYVPVADLLEELRRKLAEGKKADYISLAGSGEPTLHSGMGELIRGIREMSDIPVAVFTNGSLLWKPEVREALAGADLVLPSLDAGDGELFRYVNRPHEEVTFERMVEGLEAFTRGFSGRVWVEVLLLAGVTGIRGEVEKIARHLSRCRVDRIQLNTVVRPPAEGFARPVTQGQLRRLQEFFAGRVGIISPPAANENTPPDAGNPDGPVSSGDAVIALLERRPATPGDIACGLAMHAMEALKRLEALRAAGRVETVSIGGRTFYAVPGHRRL